MAQAMKAKRPKRHSTFLCRPVCRPYEMGEVRRHVGVGLAAVVMKQEGDFQRRRLGEQKLHCLQTEFDRARAVALLPGEVQRVVGQADAWRKRFPPA